MQIRRESLTVQATQVWEYWDVVQQTAGHGLPCSREQRQQASRAPGCQAGRAAERQGSCWGTLHGNPGMEHRSLPLPSLQVAAPKVERHLPARPGPCLPQASPQLYWDSSRCRGMKRLESRIPPRRVVSFIQEAFLNKASKYLTVHRF